MKLRLGAAVLLAALVPLTAVTAPSPATAGVDTTPPAVGSCHDLTLEEGYGFSDPDPAVSCSGRHTSLTHKVIQFAEAPNWQDRDALSVVVTRRCNSSFIDALGGSTKAIQLSAFTGWWFAPTKAQRDAGATWVRCDLSISGGDRLMPLPEDVTLDLPLPDSQAKCRKGKAADYLLTVCGRAHQFRATHAVKYPSNTYPGTRRLVRWTYRKCSDKLGRSLGLYERPSRLEWKLGFGHSLCYKSN